MPVATRASRHVLGLRAFRWLFLLFVASSAGAQSSSTWRVFRADDGLTESLTTSVMVGPRGTVWAKHGGVEAVSQLDGYTVRHIPAPGDRTYRLYESRAGKLWTADETGVREFTGEGWKPYLVPAMAAERRTNTFLNLRRPPLLPAEQDRVLILLRDRLVELRALRGEQTVLKFATNTGLGSFVDIIAASDGGVWVSGQRGLAHIAGPLRQFGPTTPWTEHLVPASLGVTGLYRLFDDEDGGVTTVGDVTGEDRRVLVHFDGRRWLTRSVPGENLRFAWRGAAPDEFWAASVNTLYRIHADRVEVASDCPRASQYFDVAVQPRGVFWLATLEGLIRQAPAAWRTPPPARPFDSVIYAATQDAAGTMWFANVNGLVEAATNRWERHPWPAGFEADFRARDGVFALPRGEIAVCAAAQLLVFDPSRRTFSDVQPPAGRRVRKVLRRLPDGVLWVQTADLGAGAGAYRLERFDGQHFTAWPEAPPAIDLGPELFFLAEAEDGALWLGGSAGIALWRGGSWQRFGASEGYADEAAMNWIELGEGRIWCAGLTRISEYDGREWHPVRGGFDRVGALLRAGDRSVWVASGSGLYRFYRDGWASVGEAEGLPSAATYTVMEDRARQIWVGTSRGVSQYFPRADPDPPHTLEITVEQSNPGTPDALVEVTSLAQDKWRFTPDDMLLFSHRLGEGAWSPWQRDRTAVFPDLPAGRYRFEARTLDRNWNVELRPAVREFRVVLPWFRDQRVLAAVLAGLAATLVFAGLAVNRHLQLRRSYAGVERMVQERTRELARATEALAQSQKMTALGTLAAGIAHDFNNILSVIRGSAQVIEAHLDDPEKVRTRVSRIKLVVDQATGVVQAMLGFGRTSGTEIKPVDVRSVVEATLRLLGDQFQRGVRLRVDAPAGLPAVRAQPDRLQQVLLNLILNAADAMGGEGEVIIRLRVAEALPSALVLRPPPAPGYVLLSVIDHGSGIAPENLPRIFEPFFTTKALSTRRGTGLGLYMTYEFAREMGQGIAVETTVGQGSTFMLVLPVAEPADPTNAAEPPAAPADGNA